MLEDYIKIIKPYIIELFSEESSGHDISYLTRTMNIAVNLCKKENGDDPSTIHHFYHKLFRLANNMNTETARKQAIERTEFMKVFVNEFLQEWNGEK